MSAAARLKTGRPQMEVNVKNEDEKNRERETRSDEDYRVGNKRPPRHTQFKPGVSGNPKGRRKGSVNLRTRVQRRLRKTVVVTRMDGRRGWSSRTSSPTACRNRR